MPFLSSSKHRERYTPPVNLAEQLEEIKKLLDALRQLDVSNRLKKDMLDAALWQVAFAAGNTQSKFMGPYRSETVINVAGLKIQRDHAYPRARLLSELLGPSPDLSSIIERALCCCIVTEEEHRRLRAVALDGWSRYAAAGITVYDMRDKRKMDLGAVSEEIGA
jgi:hypothetical protein